MNYQLRHLAVLAIVFGFVLAGSASAATDAIRVEISAVEEREGRILAAVSAFGPDGAPLQSLLAANFRATLDDTQLAIGDVQTANAARAGASVVLMVDVSGSMAGEPMNQAKRALTEFMRGLEPADQVALLAFSSNVRQVQDFTTSRVELDRAVAALTPVGDTALYDAVLEATKKALEAPAGRRLVVLLSDGEATTGLDKRAASIEEARASGVGIVSVGLGTATDRAYLTDLTNASGGRAIDAVSPAALRQAYTDIAAAIRNQDTLNLIVPPGIDRSSAAKLSLRVTNRTDAGQTDRSLPALAGAKPHPFSVTLEGTPAKATFTEVTTLKPVVPSGIQLASVDYQIDGASVHKATEAPFAYELNPEALGDGGHLLNVVAVDQRGIEGTTQMPLTVAFVAQVQETGGGGFSIPSIVPLLLLLIVAAAGGLYMFRKRQANSPSSGAGRIAPFAVRITEPTGPVEGWPMPLVQPAPVRVETGPLGTVVILDEAAIRTGSLDSIREFEIGTAPLTFGTGASCDVRVEDPEGRIAAEEARLWVQKGRLVYHKLTTLSAMATEGVTTGWQILDSGEDIQVGPYRVLYQAYEQDYAPEPPAPTIMQAIGPDDQSYFRELWTRMPDDPPMGTSSEQSA